MRYLQNRKIRACHAPHRPDGKLLLFEADTSLVVHNMDSPVAFPYKDRHMRRLFAAFRAMLYRKAGKHPMDDRLSNQT